MFRSQLQSQHACPRVASFGDEHTPQAVRAPGGVTLHSIGCVARLQRVDEQMRGRRR
jgi:hypothetical protein